MCVRGQISTTPTLATLTAHPECGVTHATKLHPLPTCHSRQYNSLVYIHVMYNPPLFHMSVQLHITFLRPEVSVLVAPTLNKLQKLSISHWILARLKLRNTACTCTCMCRIIMHLHSDMPRVVMSLLDFKMAIVCIPAIRQEVLRLS